jgi:hypothetical protein
LVLAAADAASRLALASAVSSAPFFTAVVGRSCHSWNW